MNAVLSRSQEACQWWVSRERTSVKGKGKELPELALPLPIDSKLSGVRITSYREAVNAQVYALQAFRKAFIKAEPDFIRDHRVPTLTPNHQTPLPFCAAVTPRSLKTRTNGVAEHSDSEACKGVYGHLG